MARSKDPLTAAITSLFKPGVVEFGFQRLTSRVLARVRDPILQFMEIQVSAWGGRDFCVNYSSVPLFIARQHLEWLIGGRFPRGKSNDGWWAAKTTNRAHDSMHDVVATFQSKIVAWFEQTATVPGVADEFRKCGDSSNPHIHYELGCCYAWMSDESAAVATLRHARDCYETSYNDCPSRDWCRTGIQDCDRVLAAIDNRTVMELFSEWKQQSIVNLKLNRLKGI